MFETCSKLAKKIPERHHWRRSGVFIANFERNFIYCSGASIDHFEQVNVNYANYITNDYNY